MLNGSGVSVYTDDDDIKQELAKGQKDNLFAAYMYAAYIACRIHYMPHTLYAVYIVRITHGRRCSMIHRKSRGVEALFSQRGAPFRFTFSLLLALNQEVDPSRYSALGD